MAEPNALARLRAANAANGAAPAPAAAAPTPAPKALAKAPPPPPKAAPAAAQAPAGGGLARLRAASAASGAAPAVAAKTTPIVASDARPPDPSVTEEEEVVEAAAEATAEVETETVVEEALPAPAPVVSKRTTTKSADAGKVVSGTINASGLVLLVDSFVTKGALTTSVEEWMAPAATAAGKAAKEAGDAKLPDWRATEFGRGPAYLAAALDKHISKAPPSGFITLDSGMPGFSVLMEKLVPLASIVVRH